MLFYINGLYLPYILKQILDIGITEEYRYLSKLISIMFLAIVEGLYLVTFKGYFMEQAGQKCHTI